MKQYNNTNSIYPLFLLLPPYKSLDKPFVLPCGKDVSNNQSKE